MNARFYIKATISILLLSVCLALLPLGYCPTETRYMRSDTHTINGLLAYKLLTTESSSLQEVEGASDTNFYIAIRVYIRHVDESETEITDGTSVAIANTGAGGDSTFTVSATWDCPETALASTDAIKVDVRCLCGVAWDEEVAVTIATFITEQLVATQLDANEWTVYYRIRRDHYTVGSPPFELDFYDYYFRFGIDGDDSYITGFKWTSGVTKSWHNISTWNFNLTTRKWLDVNSWNFNVSSRQWLNVASWTFNLTTMAWHTIATWSFNLISKAWNNIAQWSFQLVSLGWHTIAYWTITLPVKHVLSYFYIVLFGCIILLPFLFMIKKKKEGNISK